MKYIIYILLSFNLLTFTISAEETRQVDKHEHGVGELNIAVEGSTIEFEFMIPGADIVGFEYVAKSDEDIAKINQALKTFDDYTNIFTLPSNSLCELNGQKVALKEEDEHDDHDEHDEHDDHDEHDEHGDEHDEHDEHDDHDDHDEHDEHDEHAEENHNEFYAKYSFECGNINAIKEVNFPYFATFTNSGELEVQFISNMGSTSFEVEGDEPLINTDGKI